MLNSQKIQEFDDTKRANRSREVETNRRQWPSKLNGKHRTPNTTLKT